MPRLVWNAIVRNETAIIDRCVNSLLPHIDGAIIVDTGSTDGTPELIRQAFARALVPVEIHQAPFENFEQARNAALKAARESKLQWDYLLLADADMELKVHRADWVNGAKGLGYDLKQIAGAISYFNRRLVSRAATGWYCGVTHEYLDVESGGQLDGAEFIDHADGANRPAKISRDIALLEKALETETRPGLIQRYHFYLAGSYFDSGQWQKAAEHYKLRTTLGGFDEEVWYAQQRYALCLEHLGDKKGFLWEMLGAYELRPHRIESLHAVARHFRESGANRTSVLFSEPGLSMSAPGDLLFLNNYVYHAGMKEEFAISAYYDPARRDHGARVCNELALAGSAQARANQYWYLQPLSAHVASFKPQQINFMPPDGYIAMNPSVTCYKGKPVVLVRTVNYSITPEGHYAIRGQDGHCRRDNPINTRNYLVGCVDGVSHELARPPEWPKPKYPLVRGFEDSRLFEFDGRLWTTSTVRELNAEGWCEQVLAQVTAAGYERWTTLVPQLPRQHEKNWMPWVMDGCLRFVYRLGTLIDPTGEVIYKEDPGFDVSRISGGSQVVQIDHRTWISLVHEACTIPGRPHNRYYQHRFVSFRPFGGVDRISPPFFFHDRQIEFAAGLALIDGQLLVSYGVRDAEAWLATMDPDEVIRFIYRDAL